MKKVILSLVFVAALTVVSCKEKEAEATMDETTEAVEETATEVVEEAATVVDSAAAQVEEAVETAAE